MAVNGRQKGASYERKVANDIKALTGKECKRNLEQYRQGNHYDLVGEAVQHLAIECKRYKKLTPSLLKGWQEQTLNNANGLIPVLIYKVDYQPDVIMVFENDQWVSYPYDHLKTLVGSIEVR